MTRRGVVWYCVMWNLKNFVMQWARRQLVKKDRIHLLHPCLLTHIAPCFHLSSLTSSLPLFHSLSLSLPSVSILIIMPPEQFHFPCNQNIELRHYCCFLIDHLYICVTETMKICYHNDVKFDEKDNKTILSNTWSTIQCDISRFYDTDDHHNNNSVGCYSVVFLTWNPHVYEIVHVRAYFT